MGVHRNAYGLVNLRARKFSTLHKNRMFHCMGKIFRVKFQMHPFEIHKKYLTHTLNDAQISELVSVFDPLSSTHQVMFFSPSHNLNNDDNLPTKPWVSNFRTIRIKIQIFASYMKVRLKNVSAKFKLIYWGFNIMKKSLSLKVTAFLATPDIVKLQLALVMPYADIAIGQH